jgi:HEAT repeat protein
VLKSTAQLVADPKLAALVDELATSSEIQSSAISVGGGPGPVYDVFAALSRAASPEQMLALLDHQSPVVRGYVIWYVARTPEKLGLLEPLLDDFTEVTLHRGCRPRPTTIADLVLDTLELLPDLESVQVLLLRAAQAPQLGPRRGPVLERLAKRRPHEAAAIALSLLPQRDPLLIPSLLRTLGFAKAASSISEITAFSDSPDQTQREAVAVALGLLRSAQSKPTLLKLLKDSVPQVRAAAAESYAVQSYRDLGLIRELLADQTDDVRESVIIGLAREGSRASIELALKDIDRHKPTNRSKSGDDEWGNESLFQRMNSEHDLNILLRAVLSRSADRKARLHARSYLARVADKESLPAFRKALHETSLDTLEQISMIQAIGSLGDRESVPAIIKALADPDGFVRRAAAGALVQIRARSALAALQRAADQETSYLRYEMKAYATELAALPE